MIYNLCCSYTWLHSSELINICTHEAKHNLCEHNVREMCQHRDKIVLQRCSNNSKPHASDALISSELIS